MPEDRGWRDSWREYQRSLSLVMNWIVGMLAFSLGGHYLDRKRGGGYALTLVGMFLGLVYGGYETWKTVRGMQEQENRDGKRETGSKP